MDTKDLLLKFKKQKEELDELCNRRSLSDDFLIERGCTTRKSIGIGGDYLYGIVMVIDEVAWEWLETAIKLLERSG